VTDVAEHVVDDDGIYEDDVDMLRDVVEAAKCGMLEFSATEAEFVVMTWTEDSAMTVRAVFPEGSSEATAPASGGAIEFCPRCLEPQVRVASGVTCARGHDQLPGISRAEREQKLEERRERQSVCGDVETFSAQPKCTTSRRRPRDRRSR
jgi:hypothetical protein